jgi:hypothetical protein
MRTEKIIEKVKEFVSSSKTEEALEVLDDFVSLRMPSRINPVLLQKGRFYELKKSYHAGELNFGMYNQELNKIHNAILEFIIPEITNVSKEISFKFTELIHEKENPSIIGCFLYENKDLLCNIFGEHKNIELKWSINNYHFENCLIIGKKKRSTATFDWIILKVCSPNPLLDLKNDFVPEIIDSISQLKNLRKWVLNNLREARALIEGIGQFETIIVGGRRFEEIEKINKLTTFNQESFDCQIRTYDWILDANKL